MKIQIISDIHTEFFPEECKRNPLSYISPVADTLVIAGDLGSFDYMDDLIAELNRLREVFKTVIYVPGNHEYYGFDLCKVIDIGEFPKGIHLLLNSTVTIDGVKFIGSTMWTDFDGHCEDTMISAVRSMNDFNYISYTGSGISVRDWEYENTKAKEFIFKEINENSVVITHHAPSFKSVSEDYVPEDLVGGYANNLDKEIINTKPKLWIHGHIHASSDYTIGETRVVANPRGYPQSRGSNPEYKDDFFVEI